MLVIADDAEPHDHVWRSVVENRYETGERRFDVQAETVDRVPYVRRLHVSYSTAWHPVEVESERRPTVWSCCLSCSAVGEPV